MKIKSPTARRAASVFCLLAWLLLAFYPPGDFSAGRRELYFLLTTAFAIACVLFWPSDSMNA